MTGFQNKRGVDQLVEICRTKDFLYQEPLREATAKLQVEPQGARQVAELLQELLQCRSGSITKVFEVVGALKPGPELVEAVQRILAADAIGEAPRNPRFQPDIFGPGKVGWDGVSCSRVHDLARETLRAWRVAPRLDPDEEKRKRVEQAASKVSFESSDEQKLADLIKRFASGDRVQQYELEGAASKMGESALPVIRALLEQDLNGSLGRAAVIAMGGVKSPKILPLVELARKSTYPAVREYASVALSRLNK